MADPLTHLKQRSGDDWLLGYESREFFAVAERVLGELRSCSNSESPFTILLAEADPLKFLAHFMAACAANCHIFLANPDWADAEWQHVFDLVEPDIVWGNRATSQWRAAEPQRRRDATQGNSHTPHPTPHTPHPTPHIMIPTGGTSGKIRFAIHTWETLMASVQGFREYFEIDQVNSFCVLPLYHVSGLMQFLRSFTSGGQLVVLPFKAVERGDRGSINPETFFLSLVPTQLQRLLNQPESIHWLAQFQTVLLGGAPAWSELLEQARSHRIRLAPTYGMTETASQVVTLKPEDFLNGHTNAGQVLPHAQITICNASGKILNAYEIGNITIQAKSLAIDYYPPTPHAFQPDDLGYLDADGYLHIIGRHSDKIITGGENVFPAEVEAAIRSTDLVQDVCVLGVSDRLWGQAITAVYIPITAEISAIMIQAALTEQLSPFKRPKHWIAVDQLPRNVQGKVNRLNIEAIAKARLSNGVAID